MGRRRWRGRPRGLVAGEQRATACEQRIGRVDRLGQKANSIIIINFHVHDTIDGKVYPVTQEFPYTDPNWGYEHLRAHLGPEITEGPAPFRNGTGTEQTPVFNPDLPVAAPDAYAVGERMVWPPNGQTYECLVAATVWGPNHAPASWQVVA